MNVLRRLITATTTTLLTAAALTVPTPAQAGTLVPQVGPNPIVITPGTGRDDLVVLPATAAERDSDIQVHQDGDIAKNWYVGNFLNTSVYVAWHVNVPAAASYRISALLNAGSGQQFRLTVRGTSTSSTFTATGGWNKIDTGTLALPAGTSTIELRRIGSPSGDAQVKSIELIRASDFAAYQQRVAAARAAADLTWLRNGKYGLMYQYGAWGFPDNVGTAKSVDQQAADFNVPRFVNTVKQTGAAYVIWSISWWGYRPDMPSSTLDTIMGNGSFTAQRNLIGEVAAALRAQGIRFALYYHEGKEEAQWWQRQNFPSSFKSTGTGDRSTFFTNWTNMVTEIGQRLGTNLDGFFFDDGMVYYPARYEALEAAARTGNPARAISWNSWELPRFTEFQDVMFGEGNHGLSTPPGAPAGANGIVTTGRYAGLLEHGMFTLENDWGIHLQNQKIANTATASNTAIGWVSNASARNVSLSFDLMMYEDGSMSEKSLSLLNDLRQAIRQTPPSIPTGTTLVNDSSSAITYTGTWTQSTGRGAGDLNDDVHFTTTNGNSVSHTFTGTGIDVLGPKGSSGGNFDVHVDNVLIGRFNANAAAYTPQSVVYSARHLASGSHTIRLTKVDGTHLQLDGFRVVPNPVTHNNNAALITYNGAWSYLANRGMGDLNNDVTSSSTNGNSFTVTFTGTGLKIRGPLSSGDGTATVTVDGAPAGSVKATFSGNYTAQQLYWATDHLNPGTHTVTVTKTGGTRLQLDSVTVIP
jgi:hypothetical protein